MTVRETARGAGPQGGGTSQGFRTFQLGEAVERGIDAAGFTEPRPIQAKTIGAALAGRDVLGLAQTGTGKTAAFGLPILARLGERRGGPPTALIVAPTRELTQQIAAELALLGRFVKVKIATIIGGVAQNSQVRALATKPDIVVACPGRLLDLYEQGYVKLDQVTTLVLDEADHMFDMGFLPSIRKIVRALPRRRQNLLFSATMPKELRKLADEVLNDALVVELSNSKPTETVSHALFPTNEDMKLDLLVHLFETEKPASAIVFTRTKHRAKRMAEKLAKVGLRAVALQGNMSQGQRERAMAGFRAGRMDVLVATDIAARGIDVAAVSHVINFDLPMTPEAYTHRIGRTGRAERTGVAYTFIVPDDAPGVRAIEKLLGAPIERRYAEGFTRKSAAERGREQPNERTERSSSNARGGRSSGRGTSSRPSTGRSTESRGNARSSSPVSSSMGRGAFAKTTAARSETREPQQPFGAGLPSEKGSQESKQPPATRRTSSSTKTTSSASGPRRSSSSKSVGAKSSGRRGASRRS